MKVEIPISFIKIPTEHWHALLVHFPIALWVVGLLFFVLCFSPRFKSFEVPAAMMGMVGSLMGILAVKTGEKAAEIVGLETCVGQLIEQHGENAETAFIFFLGSFSLLTIFLFVRHVILKRSLPIVINFVPLAGMILGLVYLVKAGHEGYRLVYQHGVSVKKDAPNCKGQVP
jgi:uncharacterized membrane protein